MAEEEDKEEEEQQKNTCSTPEVSIGCCPEAVPDAMGPVLAFFFAPPPSTAVSAFAFPFPPAFGMVAAFLAGSSWTASAFTFPFPPAAFFGGMLEHVLRALQPLLKRRFDRASSVLLRFMFKNLALGPKKGGENREN